MFFKQIELRLKKSKKNKTGSDPVLKVGVHSKHQHLKLI